MFVIISCLCLALESYSLCCVNFALTNSILWPQTDENANKNNFKLLDFAKVVVCVINA